MTKMAESARAMRRGGTIALGSVVCLFATPALAQPVTTEPASGESDEDAGLQEILVTAQRRSESLQAVPISVTAIGGEALATSGISSTLTLTQAVPSIQMTRSGLSAIFFIRGVGNTNAGTGEEGGNAFYIDGIYLADLASANAEFNNVERVEILKGPQGTLFGRNSSGGLVNIITKTPGDVAEINGKVGFGNYETYKAQLYAATPLSSNVSMDIALSGKDQRNGYGVNVATGEPNMEGFYWAARSKTVWRPSDTATITFAGDYSRQKDTFGNGFTLAPGSIAPGGYSYVGPFNRNSFNPGDADIKAWGASITADVDLDFGTLTSITALRRLKSLSNVDSDFTPPITAELRIPGISDTFQQELRVASAAKSPLNWQVGMFFFRQRAGVIGQEARGTALGGIDRGQNTTSIMRTQSYSAFGEIGYEVTPTTHLTAGLRYTREDRSLDAELTPFNQTSPALITALTLLKKDSITYGKATYRAAIRQEITDDINVYASYSTGFKSGLWSLQAPAPPPVKPQTIDAFEIGFKSELFDRRARFNLAAFHYKVKNYQVRSAPTGALNPILLNATSVKVDGIEGELQVAPTEGLVLNAGFTWLKSRFGTFLNAPFTYPNPATCNNVPPAPGTPDGVVPGQSTGGPTGGNRTCLGSATGNQTPLSPKFVASLGATYTIPLGEDRELTFNALYNHNSGFYFEPENRLKQESYNVVNASAEYRFSKHWALELWMNNLTDERYYIALLSGGTGDHGELMPPRTYGANVKFSF